jgi:hypothetical protein
MVGFYLMDLSLQMIINAAIRLNSPDFFQLTYMIGLESLIDYAIIHYLLRRFLLIFVNANPLLIFCF